MAGDYYVPEIQSGNGNATYIGIVNPGAQAANLTIMGFGADGTEYGASAALTELPGMGMAYVTVNSLFGENAANIGWIKVNSLGNLQVFAEITNTGTRSAFWSSSALAKKLYMPHVAKNTTAFTTVFSAVNATDSGYQTALFPKPSGSPKILSGHQTARNKVSGDILTYFSDVSGIDWISMESNAAGTTAMEYFKYNTKNAMASLGLDGNSSKTLRFLHVATDTANFWTGMVYINVGSAAATITEYYYDASGSVLKEYKPEALASNGKVTLLFDANTQDRVPAGTSWVKVVSDQDLVGYELFGSANGTNDATFAGIQGNSTSGNVIDYPYYTGGDSTWAGFVAVNVGDAAADLTFTLMDSTGKVVATKTQTGIAPNAKFVAVGASMFPGATNGAWVQAKASASSFAGFLLWGDQGGTIRDNLSGITAMVKTVSTGGEVGERQFIPETDGNDGYDTAMVLTKGEGGWNVNVVGHLDQKAGGKITNDYGNGKDVIESVFKFTLTEPTSLVIGVRSATAAADLDMFVVAEQRPDGNFFDADEHIDPKIDFAASAQGYESVAHEYQPGTYYVLVSLFDGDATPKTDFGLLVSEAPIYLNTFNTVDDVTRHAVNAWTGTDDSNSSADWAFFEWGGTKYGNCLAQKAAATGTVEISGLETPVFDIPADGFTVIDFDSSAILNTATTDQGTSLGLYLHYEGAEDLEYVYGVVYNAGLSGDPIDVNGTQMGFLMWSRWVATVWGVGGTSFEFELEPGFKMSIVVFCGNNGQTWLLDNFRAYNVGVSLDAKIREQEHARVIFNDGKSKFSNFKLISTH